MSNQSKQQHSVAKNWDVYWTGTHENAAHQEGGPQEKVLADFWHTTFRQRVQAGQPQRLLDLACGNGAVTGHAMQIAPDLLHAYCIDYSHSAGLELGKRYPGANCIAADALSVPLPDQSFDIVCSQFGIEYAGLDAIDEATRLVAPRGLLATVMHLHNGAIYKECALNLQVIHEIQQSRLLILARHAFRAGFALNAGNGTVKEFKTTEKRFTPAVRQLEEIVAKHGADVAAGLASQLYNDIAHMYRRMSAYDKSDVLNWVDGMISELEAYAGRMSSMLDAAINEQERMELERRVGKQGFIVQPTTTLAMGHNLDPAAWVLVADRT